MQGTFESKTKQKEQTRALRSLGVALLDLPAPQLEGLDIPERLADALRAAKRMTSHEALRRQLQYIGRLMRAVDPEPIRAALAALEGSSNAARARHRRLEQWRERLLADDGALTEYAREHTGADLQELRALIRNARRELAEGKPPRAQRALFRRLRELAE